MGQYQAATGEPFIDKIRCAWVLMKAPDEVRAYLRVQLRGNCQELQASVSNSLEAADETRAGSSANEMGSNTKTSAKTTSSRTRTSTTTVKAPGFGKVPEYVSEGYSRKSRGKGESKHDDRRGYATKFPGHCSICSKAAGPSAASGPSNASVAAMNSASSCACNWASSVSEVSAMNYGEGK